MPAYLDYGGGQDVGSLTGGQSGQIGGNAGISRDEGPGVFGQMSQEFKHISKGMKGAQDLQDSLANSQLLQSMFAQHMSGRAGGTFSGRRPAPQEMQMDDFDMELLKRYLEEELGIGMA